MQYILCSSIFDQLEVAARHIHQVGAQGAGEAGDHKQAVVQAFGAAFLGEAASAVDNLVAAVHILPYYY